jgi:hypothetical protein
MEADAFMSETMNLEHQKTFLKWRVQITISYPSYSQRNGSSTTRSILTSITTTRGREIEFLRSRSIYVERWDWLSELDDLLSEKELTDLKNRKEFVSVFGKQPEYDRSELERSLEAAKLGRVKEFSVTFSGGKTQEFRTVS